MADADIQKAQDVRDKYIETLREAISGKGRPLQVEIKKSVDPYAYQNRLLRSQQFIHTHLHNRQYWDDLLYKRQINHDVVNSESHAIRYS